MTNPTAKIIYTHTDEAPALATRSFLPIIEAYAGACGVAVETRDISLGGRILDAFADLLPADQARPDTLAELGELAQRPEAWRCEFVVVDDLTDGAAASVDATVEIAAGTPGVRRV